jgi:hypothetical protein
MRLLLKSLGPGVITGAADDDPSGIATYSVAGAELGTTLLWTALLTWPLMAAVQIMCARIGMVTGQGLAGNFKQRFPSWLLRVFVMALLAANTINIAADLAPRLSPQNRPYVISSKPANGIGRRRDCFTLLQRAIARFRIEPLKWCLLLW